MRVVSNQLKLHARGGRDMGCTVQMTLISGMGCRWELHVDVRGNTVVNADGHFIETTNVVGIELVTAQGLAVIKARRIVAEQLGIKPGDVFFPMLTPIWPQTRS